jgi:hypothetical protein
VRSVLLAIAAVVAGTVILVFQFILKQMVGRHYDGWARALARSLVDLAGRVHRPRADEWTADILYLQMAEQGDAGLREALSYLCGAPKLALRAFGAVVGRHARSLDERPMSLKVSVSTVTVTVTTVPTLISTWSQGVAWALLTTAIASSGTATFLWFLHRRERRRVAKAADGAPSR